MVLQTLVLLALALFTIEYLNARAAEPCSASVTPGCYPWGGEGPAGDYSHYASKAAYLRAITIQQVVLGSAFLAPFLAPGRVSGFLASLFVGAVGVLFLAVPS